MGFALNGARDGEVTKPSSPTKMNGSAWAPITLQND